MKTRQKSLKKLKERFPFYRRRFFLVFCSSSPPRWCREHYIHWRALKMAHNIHRQLETILQRQVSVKTRFPLTASRVSRKSVGKNAIQVTMRPCVTVRVTCKRRYREARVAYITLARSRQTVLGVLPHGFSSRRESVRSLNFPKQVWYYPPVTWIIRFK